MNNIFACDVGSGHTKSIFLSGSCSFESMVKAVKVRPSLVAKLEDVVLGTDADTPPVVEVKGESFVVSDDIARFVAPEKIISTLDGNWALSPGYHALCLQALYEAASAAGAIDNGVLNVSLCLGLPQKYYHQNVDAVKELWKGMGNVRFRRAGGNDEQETVRIVVDHVYVMPQAVAAGFAAAESGLISQNVLDGRLCVIDVGTFTTDFCMLEATTYMSAPCYSNGVDIGAHSVQKMLVDLICDKYALNRETFSQAKIQRAFNHATIQKGLETIDVTDLREQAIEGAWKRVMQSLPSQWSLDEDCFVVAGGGALLFEAQVNAVATRHVFVSCGEMSQIVIVLGLASYALGRALSEE